MTRAHRTRTIPFTLTEERQIAASLRDAAAAMADPAVRKADRKAARAHDRKTAGGGWRLAVCHRCARPVATPGRCPECRAEEALVAGGSVCPQDASCLRPSGHVGGCVGWGDLADYPQEEVSDG